MIWVNWGVKKKIGYVVGATISVILIWASYHHLAPMEMTEVLGFITGAWCVWLTVEENIWNWPIGLATSTLYVLVFLRARLFADMSLQIIYIILGLTGWYFWLFGGEKHKHLKVGRAGWVTWLVLAVIVMISTWRMEIYLISIKDAAPFWDALTTTMSLAAQYMLTRKYLENWWIWIVVDVIYVFLYCYKHLYLTTGLYAVFIVMAVIGLRQWKRSMMHSESA